MKWINSNWKGCLVVLAAIAMAFQVHKVDGVVVQNQLTGTFCDLSWSDKYPHLNDDYVTFPWLCW